MKTPHTLNRWTALAAALALCAALGSGALSAKVKYYTLLEKTRSAPIVLIGTVTELRTSSVMVRVSRSIKGTTPPQIELLWDRTGTVELPAAVHTAGEDVLVFAEPKGDLYAPFAGPQGTLALQPQWDGLYDGAIRDILRFDATPAPDAKAAVLTEMLDAPNRLAQASALEVVYFQFPNTPFPTTPLVPAALRVARQSDADIAAFALRVLGRIGDESAVLPMIELMGSPNAAVAATAFAVVKAMTRADLEFDPRQSAAARASAAKKWAGWWEENRDRVVLVR